MRVLKITAAILLFFGVMVTTLAVRTPLSSLQSRMPVLLQDTESFDGSLIEGSVKELGTVNGPVDLKWKLRLTQLLTGKMGGDVEFDWLQASGNGQMAVSASKKVYIKDTIVSSPAALIETFLPFVRFGGKLRLDLVDGTASEKTYGPFVGELTWTQASISISEQAKLGDLALSMREKEGGTHAILSSEGGDITIKGTIDLQPEGSYVLDLSARAESTASNMVRNTLAQVAKEQGDGSFRIQQSGQLSELL